MIIRSKSRSRLCSITWVATSNVILEVGATPVFVDIDPSTRCIDLDRVEAAVTPRTRAIIVVHYAAHPCDMFAILAIARRHGVKAPRQDRAPGRALGWDDALTIVVYSMAPCFFKTSATATMLEIFWPMAT